MNRTLIAAVVAFAATSAFAASGEISEAPAFTSSLSRAQVQAELRQSQQAGVNPWAQDYDALAGFRSTNSRADVTAEFLRSRNETAAFTGEDSGSAWLAARGQQAPSAPVLAGQPVNAQ